MTALVFATLMAMPMYPVNPTAQDTVSLMNIHITAGLNGPGAVVSSGPEFTLKYEYVIAHPFILRAAFDYRFGEINSNVWPDGDLRRAMLSAEAIYYRGTDKLTGYVGAGVVYAMSSFTLSTSAADSLFEDFGITDVSISNVIGYRITAGLRISKSYSIEVGLTDTRPDFIYRRQYSATRFGLSDEQFRLNDFRVSVGYLFSLDI